MVVIIKHCKYWYLLKKFLIFVFSVNYHVLYLLYYREAENLWGNMETIGEMNQIVNLWLLTLEKQVCIKRFPQKWFGSRELFMNCK